MDTESLNIGLALFIYYLCLANLNLSSGTFLSNTNRSLVLSSIKGNFYRNLDCRRFLDTVFSMQKYKS